MHEQYDALNEPVWLQIASLRAISDEQDNMINAGAVIVIHVSDCRSFHH